MLIVAYVDGKPSASLTAFFHSAVEADALKIALALDLTPEVDFRPIRAAGKAAVDREACERKLVGYDVDYVREKDMLRLRAWTKRPEVEGLG